MKTLQEYCLEAVEILGNEARVAFCSPGYGVVYYKNREFYLHGPSVRNWRNLNKGLLALDVHNFKQAIDRTSCIACNGTGKEPYLELTEPCMVCGG